MLIPFYPIYALVISVFLCLKLLPISFLLFWSSLKASLDTFLNTGSSFASLLSSLHETFLEQASEFRMISAIVSSAKRNLINNLSEEMELGRDKWEVIFQWEEYLKYVKLSILKTDTVMHHENKFQNRTPLKRKGSKIKKPSPTPHKKKFIFAREASQNKKTGNLELGQNKSIDKMSQYFVSLWYPLELGTF